MNNIPLKLKILFGIEAIVGLRILLFTVPVIISKKTSGVVFPYSVDDWMIISLTYISALYLFIGIASLMGHKFWKMFHYFGAAVSLFVISFLLRFITERGGEAGVIHYAPIAFVLFVTICAALYKVKKGGPWKSVLLVDDDEILIRTIRPVLLKEGYSVLSASSGETGFNVAVKQKPSLIILDVILPGIKGRELCKKLKAEDATKDIPVVFLTSKFSDDDIKAELDAGAVAHLTKPVDKKALISTLNNILNASK